MKRSFFVVLVFLLGCQDLEANKAVSPREGPWYAVGFSSAGELVVFDATTGRVLGKGAGGGGRPRDLAWDDAGSLWLLEENEDGSGSEILRCSLVFQGDSALVGPCLHAAWVDGIAALWPNGRGVWVFEDGVAGSRVKVLRDGVVAKSVSVPRPASISQDGDRLDVFSYGMSEDTFEHFRVWGGESGIEIERRPDALGAPLVFPPTARFIGVGNDRGYLWDIVDSDLAVATLSGGTLSSFRKLAVGSPVSRIEAAAFFSGEASGEASGLSLVVSTERAWVVSNAFLDSPPAPLGLGGVVSQERAFFSRDVAVFGRAALVATDQGLRLFRVEKTESGEARGFRDERFDGDALRGPILVLCHRLDTEIR